MIKTDNSKKERAKEWLKQPSNLILIGIISLAVIIRLYYFAITKNQPLWWDEADYMAYAKTIAGIGSAKWTAIIQHRSLFSYLAAGLFKIGLSEAVVRFILEFIPSILIVFLTYKICVLMYENKKIALISAFLMATFWNILFNTCRFHVDVPALFFAFLAIYVFWQGYEKKQKIFGKIHPNWAMTLTAVFLVLTYSVRRGYFLFGLFFLIYILSTRKIKDMFKDKYNWLALAISIPLFLLVEFLIFKSFFTQVAPMYHGAARNPFNLLPLKMFSMFFSSLTNPAFSVLLYAFWIGLAILVFKLIMSVGYFRKSDLSTKSDFFNLISIILTLSFFLFWSRASTLGEPRWYFPLLLASLVCISKSTVFIADYARRYHKLLGIAVIFLLIGYGGYYELQHADLIIKDKIGSYEGIRQAGLFLRDIADENAVIIVRPRTQAAYYSERKVIQPTEMVNWEGDGLKVPMAPVMRAIQEMPEAKYLIVTLSEPGHPEFMIKEHDTNNDGRWDKIEMPFMDTTLDFVSGNHKIAQSKTYSEYNLEFVLLGIFEGDAFVYGINHLQN